MQAVQEAMSQNGLGKQPNLPLVDTFVETVAA
jgi:hypothetical protein